MFWFPFFSPQFPLCHIPGLVAKCVQIVNAYCWGYELEKNANHNREKIVLGRWMHTSQPREGYSSWVTVCEFAGVGELGKQILSSFTSFLSVFLGFTDKILIAKSAEKGKGIQSNINSLFCPCTLLGVNPSSAICPSEEDFSFTLAWAVELWSCPCLLCGVLLFQQGSSSFASLLPCLPLLGSDAHDTKCWVNRSVQLFVCYHGCPSV